MPCTRCRTRHYRCDGKQPQCGRCQQADKECLYDTGRRFRRSSIQEAFSGQQQWVPLPPNFTFVDNSDEARGLPYSEELSGADFSSTTTPTLGFSSPGAMGFSSPGPTAFGFENPNPSHASPSSLIGPTQGLTVGSLLTSDASPRSRYPSASAPATPYGTHDSPTDYNRSAGPTRQARPQPSPVLWPLRDDREAMLLRHYVENVSLFFDMVDDQRHFGNRLVQLSKNNSTLLNSILALSARHLSNTTGTNHTVAFEYYHRCITVLHNDVKNANELGISITDEQLAAMIILRLYEEMSILVEGSDPKLHLPVVQAIVAQQSHASYTGGLQQAIIWAAFRQELWISLMEKRPFQLDIFRPDKSFDDASDSVWATRSIAHVAEVCHFVFGKERKSLGFISGYDQLSEEQRQLFTICKRKYEELMEDNRKWRSERPSSFDPFYLKQDRDGSGRDFPDIRLHEFPHVVGRQYNKLAHALLVAYEPSVDQDTSSLEQTRLRTNDNLVREYVRELCGVAMSNPKAFPAKLVACFAIARVGDRFTAREDQSKLREMLVETQRTHGFPTAATREELETAWGWHESWRIR